MSHRRRLPAVAVVAVTVALLAITACTSTVAGTGSASPVPSTTSSAATSGSPLPSSGGPTPTSASSQVPPSSEPSPSAAPSSSAPSSSVPPSSRTVRAPMAEPISSFNPYNPSSSGGLSAQDVARMVLPTPMVTTPEFRYQADPDLLTGAPLVSDTGGHHTITMTIRPTAVWSDRTPITGADLAYVWRAASQDPADFYVDGIANVQSVTATGPGKRTAVITLKKPDSEWPALFPALLPSHYLTARSKNPKTAIAGFAQGIPVSAGPMRIGTVAKGGATVTLHRNDKYFGRRAQIGGLVLQAVSDPAAAAAGLRAGEFDLVTSTAPTPQLLAQLKSSPATVAQVPGGTLPSLLFNVKSPRVADVRVRKALALSLDRGEIGQLAAPDRTVRPLIGNNLIPAYQEGYVAHDAAYRRPAIAETGILLTRAGYKKGGDGIYAKGGKPLTVKLSLSSTSPAIMGIGQLIQAQAKRAGISVTLNPFTGNAFFTLLDSGKFDAILLSYPVFANNAQSALETFGCDLASNYMRYCNHGLDTWLTRALAATDNATRLRDVNSADELIWADLPILPFAERIAIVATARTLHGVTFNPALGSVFWDVSSWRAE